MSESPVTEVKLAVIEEKLTTMGNNVVQFKEENTKQNNLIIEQVKKTNGRVSELERKQIEHETEMKIVKQLRDRRASDWIAPMFTALVTGGVLLLGERLASRFL
jgi:recombinational DNA repair ATPase RecF